MGSTILGLPGMGAGGKLRGKFRGKSAGDWAEKGGIWVDDWERGDRPAEVDSPGIGVPWADQSFPALSFPDRSFPAKMVRPQIRKPILFWVAF